MKLNFMKMRLGIAYFIEGDIFKTIIPLTTHANPQVTMQADEEISKFT